MQALEETDIAIESSAVQWEARGADRHYTMRRDYFVKSELHPDERGPLRRHQDGPHAVLVAPPPAWSEERLRNEHAAMKFVKKHTTIPVPWHAVYRKNGLLQLATKRVRGVKLADIAPAARLDAALRAVEQQILGDIMPQLRVLSRRYVGSADDSLPIMPPPRLLDHHDHDHRFGCFPGRARSWPLVEADAGAEAFVFCHNDLSPDNIFVDHETFRICAIIDWEYAGFFPACFEIPLWRAVHPAQKHALYASARARDLAFFGLRPQDLRQDYLLDEA